MERLDKWNIKSRRDTSLKKSTTHKERGRHANDSRISMNGRVWDRTSCSLLTMDTSRGDYSSDKAFPVSLQTSYSSIVSFHISSSLPVIPCCSCLGCRTLDQGTYSYVRSPILCTSKGPGPFDDLPFRKF
jgi:hypothetical protein